MYPLGNTTVNFELWILPSWKRSRLFLQSVHVAISGLWQYSELHKSIYKISIVINSYCNTFQLFIKTFPLVWFDFFFQFEQADEATRNRRALEIEKEDTDELQQKYQVGSFACTLYHPFLSTCTCLVLSVMDYMGRLRPKWVGIS